MRTSMQGCPDFFPELNWELAFWYRVIFFYFTPLTESCRHETMNFQC